uniref:Phosphatidic acid phosphatase type 2/haloperoxidase domain-containing protein n=1 Tax=viral metagenome TaxID=1070528 RepID=A0A6C0AST0_9ZZZZ
MSMFMNLFNEIGGNGPIILNFLSIYLLWDKHNLLFYYIIGIFVNTILNLILKGIFQQPRPSEDYDKFNLALKNGKRFIFKNGVPFDIFGMPSGHAQSALYSTVFIYLALQKTNILYLYLLFSLLIITQRVVYNYHTVFQVIVGAFVGVLFGYFVFSLAEKKIKNRIREKSDDFGPI